MQREAEAERVRSEVAYELRLAVAGHDEALLERCLAAAQRNGVAKADVTAARAKLKKLSGAREAAIAAARELEASETAAADLSGKLALTQDCHSPILYSVWHTKGEGGYPSSAVSHSAL